MKVIVMVYKEEDSGTKSVASHRLKDGAEYTIKIDGESVFFRRRKQMSGEECVSVLQ